MVNIGKVLMNKLNNLGYTDASVEEKISKLDLDIIEMQIENDPEKYISVRKYDSPTIEIAKTLINHDKSYMQNVVLDGHVEIATSNTFLNTELPIADYNLDENVCIVSTTTSLKIEILIYTPNEKTKTKYSQRQYEEEFAEERNNIAREYYDAFLANGRVDANKVKDILQMLMLEYIIDEITVYGVNPKIKMYDTPDSYADNITEYRLKYINRKTNRIELAYKPLRLKRLGANVEAGLVTNDPYIKLNEMPAIADFPLDEVSCYWTILPDGKNEEVAIYVANKEYDECQTYRKFYSQNLKKYDELANQIIMQLRRDVTIEIDKDYIISVLERLNPELLIPSMDIIRDCMENPADPIEPIKYKFKAINSPESFEEQLYISIVDNVGKRYKYKLSENIMEDLTRIGNKLEYTTEDGKLIQKQSVADFNINSYTAIIRRETLIDYSKITGLLGYIYEDIEYIGTDMLPVPNIEVDFYVPTNCFEQVQMYNGTNFATDYAQISNDTKFYTDNNVNAESNTPGTSYALVKYIDSNGNILKENKIYNLYPGTSFSPNVIPTINDTNGGEWVCTNTQYPMMIINNDPSYNVIEIKYKEKKSKVKITFLNRDGKKLRDDLIEPIQVGITYDTTSKDSFNDGNGNEWRLISARPQKLLIREEEDKNNLILMYDVEKEKVLLRCYNPDGQLISEPVENEVQVGKKYELPVKEIIFDNEGMCWKYEFEMPVIHLVEKGKDNVVDLKYSPYNLPVKVIHKTEDGIKVKNDLIEYYQVGQKYVAHYEDDIVDYSLKKWRFKSISASEIIINADENKNIIDVIYEPVLTSVFVQIVNENGVKLVNPIEKTAQIGAEFMSNTLDEIMDNYGKYWKKEGEGSSLVVSEKASENNIVIKYRPLVSKVKVKYYDEEKNELIPEKTYEKQAGTKFRPEVIEKLESNDGRKWCCKQKSISEYTVKKNEEENIISIYYDKDMTKVSISFFDKFGNNIKDSVETEAQIGSEFSAHLYKIIEDKNGVKTMLASTEPKKLIVKSDNNIYKFMYDEIKATVLIKHVNVSNNQTICENVVTSYKLGGIYVPNIRHKILDNNKLAWKYVGANDISIITKENEQENIIILQYDEEKSNVCVRYLDTANNELRSDVVYECQIGKEIDTKKIDKIIDNRKYGWKYSSTKCKNMNVNEDIQENEVINYYEPLIADIKTRYIDENGKELIDTVENKLQVGKDFIPTYELDIKDMEKRSWRFKEISTGNLKVSEHDNLIEVKYVPVLSNVCIRYFNKNGETIKDDLIKEYQVGSIINFNPKTVLVDSNGKKWDFVKIDKTKIEVNENAGNNVVNEFFEPKMASGFIKVIDDENNEIITPIKFNAQIGEKYVGNVEEKYIDSRTKLGWKKPQNADVSIVVNEELDNTITVKFEKDIVSAYVKILDEHGKEIIPMTENKMQVGTRYEPEIRDTFNDENGKRWNLVSNIRNILVDQDSRKNILELKYEPVYVEGIIKYRDNFGNTIASDETFRAQIGSEYSPNVKLMIVDANKNKWAYNENSKSHIIIDEDEQKNIIILSYEEEKAPIIYKYIDEYNNRLKLPKKELGQIGSIFVPNIENVIEDESGRAWEYKSANIEKLEVKDSEQENVIEITYVPLNVKVKLLMKNKKGELISSAISKAQLGSIYKPDIDENIYDENSMMYKFVKCEPNELLIKEVPIGSEEEINIFEIIYEPVYSNVSIIFQDIDGNRLRDDEIVQLQVGTKYTPKYIQYVKDKRGMQWENISNQVDAIRVMEDVKSNVIKMTYEIAKAEVLVKYKNIEGNTIKESQRFNEKVGNDFVPQVDNVVEDANGCKWIFVDADPVKLTVGSINNIITLNYQEKKVPVIIKYETILGKKIREDTVENVQEGRKFTPKKKYPVIYDNDEIWSYVELKPSSIIVTSNQSENIITQVYDNNAPKNENTFEHISSDTKTNEIINEVPDEKIQNEEKTIIQENDMIHFTEQNLIELSKNILLDSSEYEPISKLNDYNKKIINKLDEFRNNVDFDKQFDVIRDISSLMNSEKDIIQNSLSNMFSNDKTGKKFLKILEAIVRDDTKYEKLQARKVVLLTDYFINPKITQFEQANYICERGKNDKELLIIRNKLEENRSNKDELADLYVDLIYEKAMIDNYYRARTNTKDEYFINEEAKSLVDSDVVIMVTNLLPNQAYTLLKKENLSAAQENELDAIINLINDQQGKTLENLINTTPDNKLKKMMQKRLKNIR